MKYLSILSVLFFLGCTQNSKLPEFATDDPVKLEEYADQAILEAEQLLDSLSNTPILNPDI